LIAAAGGFSNGVTVFSDGSPMNIENAPKSELRSDQTIEIGYVGKIKNKLAISVDVYQIKRQNFTALRQISPLVALPNIAADYDAIVRPIWEEIFTDFYMGFGGGMDEATATATAQAVVDELISLAYKPIADGYATAVGVIQTEQVASIGDGIPHMAFGYRNFGEITYYGSDVSLNYFMNKNISFFGNYSWVSQNSFSGEDLGEGPNSTNNYDLNVAKHKTRLGANYTADKGIVGGLAFKHNSEFESTLGLYGGTVESRSLLDANLGYKLESGLYFNVAVDNVLGTKYRTYPALPQIGTRLLVTARYSF
jgi:iron complex outermembrane receptor protein